MTLCPRDDHEFSFEHGGESYCEEHGIRLLHHPAPMGPQFAQPTTEPAGMHRDEAEHHVPMEVAVTAPFALQFAEPRLPEPVTPFTYDTTQQINLCPDGSPAATNHAVLLSTGATSSSAGSKTHSDDD